MKKLLTLALCASALGLANSALAQAAGPVGGAPQAPAAGKHAKIDRKAMQKINEEILEKLNLTDDQKAKLKVHQDERAGKLKELKKGAKGAGNTEEVKEKIKAARKEEQQFMKNLLTKDQMKEMQKLRREAVKKLQDKDGAKP